MCRVWYEVLHFVQYNYASKPTRYIGNAYYNRLLPLHFRVFRSTLSLDFFSLRIMGKGYIMEGGRTFGARGVVNQFESGVIILYLFASNLGWLQL